LAQTPASCDLVLVVDDRLCCGRPFGGLIARQFASSTWPLSGCGALRFITDDALRQPLAGLDHGLVSVLRPETLQQASEKRLR